MLKTSENSVHSTNENYNVFNSRDEISLAFNKKKSKFSFYFILFIGYMLCLTTEKGGAENAKTKILANPNNFGTIIFVTS